MAEKVAEVLLNADRHKVGGFYKSSLNGTLFKHL